MMIACQLVPVKNLKGSSGWRAISKDVDDSRSNRKRGVGIPSTLQAIPDGSWKMAARFPTAWKESLKANRPTGNKRVWNWQARLMLALSSLARMNGWMNEFKWMIQWMNWSNEIRRHEAKEGRNVTLGMCRLQAALCRCSQPLSGFSARCVEDEQLLNCIVQANPNAKFMYVVDTRPRVS